MPIVVCVGEAPVPNGGDGDDPILGKLRVEHQQNFVNHSGGGKNCRQQEYFRKNHKEAYA